MSDFKAESCCDCGAEFNDQEEIFLLARGYCNVTYGEGRFAFHGGTRKTKHVFCKKCYVKLLSPGGQKVD